MTICDLPSATERPSRPKESRGSRHIREDVADPRTGSGAMCPPVYCRAVATPCRHLVVSVMSSPRGTEGPRCSVTPRDPWVVHALCPCSRPGPHSCRSAALVSWLASRLRAYLLEGGQVFQPMRRAHDTRNPHTLHEAESLRRSTRRSGCRSGDTRFRSLRTSRDHWNRAVA